MARTNETPEQRKARTAKARETLAKRFPNERARRKHYQQMAQKRWAAKDAGGPDGIDHAEPTPSD